MNLKAKLNYIKLIFDFETVINKTHKPYIVCYEPEDGECSSFTGENCVVDMLNNLPD